MSTQTEQTTVLPLAIEAERSKELAAAQAEIHKEHEAANAKLMNELKIAGYIISIALNAYAKIKSQGYHMPHAEVDWLYQLYPKAKQWAASKGFMGITFSDEKLLDEAIRARKEEL